MRARARLSVPVNGNIAAPDASADGRIVRVAGGTHARQRAKAFHNLFEHGETALRRKVGIPEIHLNQENAVAIEAGIQCRQLEESRKHQSRSHYEDERESDLQRDQRFPETESRTLNHTAGIRFHGGLRLHASSAPCRSEAEEKTGQNRDSSGECQHAAVDTEVQINRQAR